MGKNHERAGHIPHARGIFTALSCLAWLLGSPTSVHAQSAYCELARLTPCVGLFELGQQLGPYIGLPAELATADFNSDGHLDLVATDIRSPRLVLYLGRGDGTFEGPLSVPTSSAPYYLAVGDLDGDGAADVAAAMSPYGVVSLLFGDGAGGFPRTALLTVGWETRALAISDLNGDGRDDLVVTRAKPGPTGSAYVYFGPVRGDPTVPLEVPIPGTSLKAVVTDLNGNGRRDLVILEMGKGAPDNLAILSDFTDAGPSDQRVVELPPGSTAMGFAVADFNGDHRADLAVTEAGGTRARCLVFLADEHGGFQAPQAYPVSPIPNSVQASDVNQDGIPDLLVTCQVASTVSCLLGRGDGTFVPQGDYCTAGRPFPLVVADFNEDGWPDVATGSPINRSIDFLINRRLSLGTPFRVIGRVIPPPGGSGGRTPNLFRVELPRWVAARDVDVQSIRIEGKALASLQPVHQGIAENSEARQLLLRVDPSDLAALDPGDDATALTGCLYDGRPFAGPIYWRPGARDLDRLARNEPGVGARAVGGRVQFSFPAGVSGQWTVRIFDVHGGLIWSRSERVAPGGAIVWDQTSRTGGRVPSGVYFYRAESDVGTAAGKLPVLR